MQQLFGLRSAGGDDTIGGVDDGDRQQQGLTDSATSSSCHCPFQRTSAKVDMCSNAKCIACFHPFDGIWSRICHATGFANVSGYILAIISLRVESCSHSRVRRRGCGNKYFPTTFRVSDPKLIAKAIEVVESIHVCRSYVSLNTSPRKGWVAMSCRATQANDDK